MDRASSRRTSSFGLTLSLLCVSCFLASTGLGKEEGRAERRGEGKSDDSASPRRTGEGAKVGAAGAEAIAGGEKGGEDGKKQRPPRVSSVPELSPR